MRSTEHRPTRSTSAAASGKDASDQLAAEAHTDDDTATLATIATTAARLAELLDEIRARQPGDGLTGPNSDRVTLDQAAAAAADLHALVASLITEHD